MQAHQLDQAAGAVPAAYGEKFGVKLRLSSERLLVEGADGRWREREHAVLCLCFDYGGVEVRPQHDDAWEQAESAEPEIERDLRAERAVQARIERYGAVEIDHLESVVAPHGVRADYLINVDDNVHAICSFSGLAVEELRALGWQVEIAPDFQFQVVGSAERWVARLGDVRDKAEWFQLELGLEVDGEVIDLVPALIKLLEEAPKGARLSSLSRQVARCRALPVAKGRFVAIPWERLEPILAVLAELYDGQGRKLRLHETNLAAVGRLTEALEGRGRVLSWTGRSDAVERGQKLGRTPAGAARPAVLHAELRPYQADGLTWLCHLRDHGVGGVLADDMGLGKTLQTIALLAIEKEQRRMDLPALVVVPTSLVEGWRRQIRQFAPHLRVLVLHGGKRHAAFEKLSGSDVVLTTYSVLTRDLSRFREHEYHYVILDEAQAIKNARSQASQSARTLRARHRLALTGTPVENNLDELWSLFEFVMPGLLGSAQRFRSGFRYPIEREGNETRLHALRSRVSPFVLRRLKETVARDLPPKTELVRHVSFEEDQRDLYESIRVAAHAEVRSAIRRQGFEASSLMILDALTKLRQVCCDPRLVQVDAARDVKTSAKAEAFYSLLAGELGRGRRVLVFSQFARMLALLSQGLTERDIRHVTLTGASQERHKLVDSFQSGEADVFLISLKAGGTGLTLTRADTVIHYDPWWNAAAQMQATDRAHRIGQTQPVFVHNLVVAGSVEERMLELQQRKRNLADTLLGSEVGTLRLLPDDVESLLSPLGEDG
ncbi:MAG: DEAD/DEAH box helicase [Myxococcales bacterium]|nr:DEAD/DEAH box helicase [Myxococcales bacterium]